MFAEARLFALRPGLILSHTWSSAVSLPRGACRWCLMARVRSHHLPLCKARLRHTASRRDTRCLDFWNSSTQRRRSRRHPSPGRSRAPAVSSWPSEGRCNWRRPVRRARRALEVSVRAFAVARRPHRNEIRLKPELVSLTRCSRRARRRNRTSMFGGVVAGW
jgi:hypothetical protein